MAEAQTSALPLPPAPPPLQSGATERRALTDRELRLRKPGFSYIRRGLPTEETETDRAIDAAAESQPPPPGETAPDLGETATAPTAPPPAAPSPPAAPPLLDEATAIRPDPTAAAPPEPPAPRMVEREIARIEDSATPPPLSPELTPADDFMTSGPGPTATARAAPDPDFEAMPAPTRPRWENVRSAKAIPDQNSVYDEDSPGFSTLQKANQALQGFPALNERGDLDWVTALSSRLIDPRTSLSRNGEMLVMDLDIVMKDTKSTRFVRFRHKTHTQWLECSNCHQQIFKPVIGANPISMAAILDGKYCGVCHNSVAFNTSNCERCHSVPRDG